MEGVDQQIRARSLAFGFQHVDSASELPFPDWRHGSVSCYATNGERSWHLAVGKTELGGRNDALTARLAAVVANHNARLWTVTDALCQLARSPTVRAARQRSAQRIRTVGRIGIAILRRRSLDCISTDGDARYAGSLNVEPNGRNAALMR